MSSAQEPADRNLGDLVPVAESDLMQLLGHVIKNVSDEGEGTLRIGFDTDEVLRCYDPPGPYESYHIQDVDKRTIV